MLERLVAWCIRRPWLVVFAALALTAGGAYLTATRFAIDTDTNNLFSPAVKWRQNKSSLYKSFPQLDEIIVAVIDAKTSQQADDAAAKLYEALRGKPLIQRVWRPDDNQFFRENPDEQGLNLCQVPGSPNGDFLGVQGDPFAIRQFEQEHLIG